MNMHWIPNHRGFPCLFLLTSTFPPTMDPSPEMGNYGTSEPERIFDVIYWPHPLRAEILSQCGGHFLWSIWGWARGTDRPPHISLFPSHASGSYLLAMVPLDLWSCWAPKAIADLPISWKEINKYRLEFSEELPESWDFLRKWSRSWPTEEEIAKITGTSSMVRTEHLYLCVTHLTVASLPAVWDLKSGDRDLDSELEGLGDFGHWYPALDASLLSVHLTAFSFISSGWMRYWHTCMPDKVHVGMNTSKARLQVWAFL